jgi:two-component system sensor histidine kinase QseC
MFSMRRYLLVTLLLVAGGSMVLTGWWSYREAAHEVEELFDAQLAQSARVLVATLTTRPLLVEDTGEDTVVFPAWHPENGSVARDTEKRDVAAAGHKYETRLAFQLWEGEGERLLMRSENAPLTSLAAFRPGYAAVVIDEKKFQVFSVAHEGMWLQVAQDDYIRGELAMEIAVASLLPHLAGLPFMAVLIWLLVAHGLRPLDELRVAIAGRDVAHLRPVEANASVELQPVVEELNRLLAHLEESFGRERRFTSEAAHELRTPLAVLRIHAENALAAGNEGERQAALGMLLRGVDRASRLVEQLLTLARVDPEVAAHRFELLRLNALVREEMAALVPVASRRQQELGFDEAGDYSVQGNRALIGILVRNLVDNALRYSPEGGCVHVALRPPRDAGEQLGVPCVVLTVDDDGPGVPPALAARVFERFFRADTARGDGAGLGLSIVARIVELHGGVVRVRPRQGDVAGGFAVSLPATPAQRLLPP